MSPGGNGVRLDPEKVWGVLERLQAQQSPADAQCVRRAAVALAFLVEDGHADDFEDYLSCFSREAPTGAFPSFATLEQAQTWLRGPLDARSAQGAWIAGAGYAVSYSQEEGLRSLVRVPSESELMTGAPVAPVGDLEDCLATLRRMGTRENAPEVMEAIRVALLAVYFLVESGRTRDFERFLSVFDSSAPRHVLRSFPTRDEAQAWLDNHPRPPHGARVDIAGQTFSVGYSREQDLRTLVRAPRIEVQDNP